MNRISNILNSYVSHVNLIEKKDCDTKSKKIGYSIGSSINTLVSNTSKVVIKAVHIAKKMDVIAKIYLNTIAHIGKNQFNKFEHFAVDAFKKIANSPTGQVINEKVKALHLGDRFTKVKNTFISGLNSAKSQVKKAASSFNQKVIFPIINKANMNRGPAGSKLKKLSNEFTNFTYMKVVKPGMELTKKVAGYVLTKLDPMRIPLKNNVINPVMKKVVEPAFIFAFNMAVATTSGYIKH